MSLHIGSVIAEWCTACKAYTRLTGEAVLITTEGVSTVGTWEWCEVHDDPGDQEVTRA